MDSVDSTSVSPVATRTFAIPEIATAILGTLSQKDLARVCRVSHRMFDLAVPLLWKDSMASGMLELLDSEDVYEGILNGKTYTFDEFLVYSLVGRFERFNIYAPYIESLEISEEDLDWSWCRTSEWKALRREASQRNGPMLPRLKVMRFTENSSSTHGILELEWIMAFATPDMKEISFVPDLSSLDSTIPYSFASIILQALASRSPNIQTLALVANDEIYATANRFALQTVRKYQAFEPWYYQLQHFQNLHHLTVSEGWLLPPCLQAMGQLPNLASLCIVPGTYKGFDPWLHIDPELPTELFPQLRQLSVHHLSGLCIGEILSVTTMLRGITTLELEVGEDGLNYSEDELDMAISSVFDGLQNLPCLQKLIISVLSSKVEWPVDISQYLPYMGEHTSVDFVSIRGMCIDAGWDFLNPNMTSMWQNVQTLSMPSQPGSIDELALFATMPRLSFLLVDLDLRSPHLPKKPNPGNLQKFTLESSWKVRLSSEFEDLVLLAQALRHLWPKLKGIKWADEDDILPSALALYFNKRILRLKETYLFGKPQEGSECEPGPPEVPERVKVAFSDFIGKFRSTE